MSLASPSYIDQLLERMRARLSASEFPLAETFARLFWSRTLDEDLAVRDVDDDAGATIEAWERLSDHPLDGISFHLMNPEHARDGWQSSHTIVEVTAPNMPFMVDSVLMALSHGGLVTHHLNNVVFAVDRDEHGAITHLSVDLDHPHRELLIYAEIDRLQDDMLAQLRSRLEEMALELQAVVTDFSDMKACLSEVTAQLRTLPPPLPDDEVQEAIAFLEWLLAFHFTFLGYREFEYHDGTMRQTGPALGMQRVRSNATERRIEEQPADTQRFLLAPNLLSFSKSGTKSRVHRPAYPDYIGVKRFSTDGKVIGEIGFLGLYTSRVYQEFPERIPVVRRKVARTLERSGLDPAGFDGKVLAQVLATFPRDELLQISEDELFSTAMIITDIHERRRVRVFPRYGAYGLFVTTLVYMPRDLFSTAVRLKLQALLMETFDAVDTDHDIFLSESILVRVQFNLRVRPGSRTHVDRVELERRITELIGDWYSELNESLIQQFGESRGRGLNREYVNAFPAGYREQFPARGAADDVAAIEALSAAAPVSTRLYRLPGDAETRVRLKVFHLGAPLPLSEVVPKLENLGLKVTSEHPYQLKRKSGPQTAVHDFDLIYESPLEVREAGPDFDTAFVRIWHGQVEDDGFNRLILGAGLDWRQVSILRAYAQYMKQTQLGFSQQFIGDTLYKHKALAELLVDYFETRFAVDHAEDRDQRLQALRGSILVGLEGVALLNEDRILRRFLEMMEASLRTNYHVVDDQGAHRSFLSLKLAPARIPNLPRPLPAFEIFVSAPHMEGVHLRGGPIARGGLRWSDRFEDYRTEVLGLVKAQVVKNAVIVPTGAKGGFVAKAAVPGVDCYRDFIRGLLDVTDNIVDAEVVSPSRVRVLDGPDPYLVVAADKGTAAFSDTANAVAEEYGFWLGDAFASGGSYGYDHKKMGITARGAWISVQRHFAERQIDVQTESVTVLGIGDMGGDVFGNGLLSSRMLKLVAAFNHLHIFIDPHPDPQQSFEERSRLFALPRSSWGDYDTGRISAGGGVFPRSAKAIAISAEMREVFDLQAESLPPDELIHHLLKSPVQLIWNGGIGTYVKAGGEDDDDVGDRANDHLRVNGRDLRCTVFGEGGNLGLTQRARVEFSLNGGAVNTDFIDNAGGVDCSDHEVNIKIVLNELVHREDLTRKQRNTLLEQMTDAVAELVLNNNYRQAQALSVAQRHSATRQAEYQRCITYFAQHAGLDRELEHLPSDEQLAERHAAGQALTRPELAVLLAYAKTHIKQALIQSDLHTDALVAEQIFTAFPAVLCERYSEQIRSHRLAREIIATQLANEMVDFMGLSFVVRQIEIVGVAVVDIARAYAAVAHCYGFTDWFREVRELEVPARLKLDLWLEVVRLGRRAARWMLRHDQGKATHDLVAKYQPDLEALLAGDPHLADSGAVWPARAEELVRLGVPAPLAQKSAQAADLARLLPVIDVAQTRGVDGEQLRRVSVAVSRALDIEWLAMQLVELAVSSHWQAMERDSLLDEMYVRQTVLGALVLQQADGDVYRWLEQHPHFRSIWQAAVDSARQSPGVDFAMYSILSRRLADLCAGIDT